MVVIKFFKVLILSFCISCSSQKKGVTQEAKSNRDIFGVYVTNNHPYKEPNSEEITILLDSTVKYKLNLELYGNREIAGTWKLKKDTLNLFLEIPPKKIDGKIKVEFESKKQKEINISIVDNEGKLLDGSYVFINEKEYLIDLNKLKINSQFIDKIKIDYFGETYEILIGKLVDSDIKLILTPNKWRNIIYEFAKNKWLVKENKLIELKDNNVNEKCFLIKRN